MQRDLSVKVHSSLKVDEMLKKAYSIFSFIGCGTEYESGSHFTAV